jgi:hypothetical protein
VFPSGAVLPEPVEVTGRSIPLPTEPIEPYLLTREAGPFMVMAHVFRGENATRKAQALAIEMRREHNLPAYIFFVKVQPGGSNIRDVPPTADRYVKSPRLTDPELSRSVDEAAVLVGNCKTIDESEDLLKQVKKIRPRVLEATGTSFQWRNGKGLKYAMLTTNPLTPAQDIYPGKPQVIHNGAVVDPTALTQFRPKADPLVERMNQGPHSLFKCPGPLTMVVAEFAGRSTLDSDDPDFKVASFFEKSPLKSAHEDAEALAEQLSKRPDLQALGVKAYVYHDRTSSRVMLGSYASPKDPKATQVYEAALKIQYESTSGKKGRTQQFLAPSPNLMPVPKQ